MTPVRRVLAALLCFVLLVVAQAAAPRLAFADDVADEADHLFTLGAERYQEKDYKGALQHFLASNRLVRNRNVMFNIARTYEHLKQFSDAYRYYQRSLDGETDAAVKQRIKEALARIGPSVALLTVTTEPPGALVYLNRKDLGDRGAAPQTLALVPGTYTVIADLAGYDEVTMPNLDLRVGTERTVHLKLTRVVGTVRVSGADGAAVRVDTEDSPVVCTAPCDVPVPPGPHTLVFTRAGSRQSRIGVQVKANTLSNLKVDLEAETGQLVVNADERDAVIEIDGKTQGFTPSVLNVPAGEHDVRVTLRGFKPVIRRVEVKVNQQTQLDLSLVSNDAVEAASRTAESIDDAPASVSLIPSSELRAMRYPTVAEALRGVRGVFVSDDRGYKSLGFRGFGRPGDYGNRVLVLVDGHPTNDNWVWSSYSGYDLRTDLDDVERIEVVRGPGSLLYGTGAFSGVVNVVLAGNDSPDGREVGVSAAEEGVMRARARVTHHFTRDFGVWTSVSAGRSSGRDIFVKEYVPVGPPSLNGTARGADGFHMGTWAGKLFYKSFSMQWSLHHHDKHLPAGQFDTLFGDARTHQADTRGFLEAKLTPQLGEQLESMTRAHANLYAYRSFFARSPQNGGVERDFYDGKWIGLEQRIVYKPVKLLRLTGGGEVQGHLQANQGALDETGVFLDDKRTFTLVAGYATADVVPSEAFKLQAGARFDSYSTFGSSINPRAAIIVKPYDGGNLKIMGGKAFRAPSIYELFNQAGGGQKASTGLEPENLYSAEIEYSHRFSKTVVGTVAVYANYIQNLIALRDLPDATPDSPSYAYQNTKSPVGTLGGEVEVRREWKEGWMVSASYSLQKSRYLKSSSFGDVISFAPARDLREVPNSPNHLASVKGGVPILGRALMLMNRLSVEGPRPDRNDRVAPNAPPQLDTPPAVLWDIVFSGGEPRWGLQYAVGVYNAFDARWSVPVSAEFRQTTMPQNGRTFLASGTLTF
ncbi:MAG: TonB-dependent receptor [Deltaproteobacteria bacterium]|nr:TonB-dependent receptor [Deltaproteobacteria bacterium]